MPDVRPVAELGQGGANAKRSYLVPRSLLLTIPELRFTGFRERKIPDVV